MRRSALSALFAVGLVAALFPASSAAAVVAIDAKPVLTSPVGGTVASSIVEFTWQRVPGAARYQLQVRHASSSGFVLVEVETVNDRYSAKVDLAGDLAYWAVRAIGGNGGAGPWVAATFHTARPAPELLAPPDGAAFTFPDTAPFPDWRTEPEARVGLYARQHTDPFEMADRYTGVFAPGSWQWRVAGGWSWPDGVSLPEPSVTRSFSVSWPDAVPDLIAPADDAVVPATRRIRLEWDPVQGAGWFAWQLTKVGGELRYYSTNDPRANWADIDQELETGEWEWQVRAVMSGSSMDDRVFGPWSEARRFTVAPPVTPAQTSPASGASLDRWPVLTWSPVPGAENYQIQVSDTPDATVPLAFPLAAAFAFGAPGSDARYAATTAAATRWWRVRAHAGSAESAWSAWRSFSVAPTQPTLLEATPATRLGPADCASSACPDLDGIPILRWDPVPGATSYRVFFRWDGSAGPADRWDDVGSTGMALPEVTQTSPGDRTAWAVLACPSAGCPEVMPEARSRFRLAIPAPVLLGPADGATQPRPSVEMRWEPIPSPTAIDLLPFYIAYRLEWTRTPGDYSASDLYQGSPGASTFFTVDAIKSDVTLAWRIRAVTGPGYDGTLASAWTPWRSIVRDEPPITLVGPAAGMLIGSTPKLDWQALPFVVSRYHVEVVRIDSLPHYGAEHAGWVAFTGATSLQLPELAPGDYRWRVRRVGAMYQQLDTDGQWSTSTFTVAGERSITMTTPAPGDSQRGDDVLLAWEPFHHADSYVVLIGPDPDLTTENAIYDAWSHGSTHAVTQALPAGDLFWRVCAIMCGPPTYLVGADSPVRAITVTAPPGPDSIGPVSAVSTLTPRTGLTIGATGSTPTTVVWTSSDTASGIGAQELELRRGSGPWQAIAVTDTARSALVTPVPGATYTVRVRATDSVGNTGAWATTSVEPVLRQENSSMWRWSTGWTRTTSSTASGGATRWATRPGASATITVNARAIALVAPKATTRGSADIWVDGVKVATIRLDTSPAGGRRIVFARGWSAVGPHTVVVKLVGTSGHPRVDIDVLATLR